MQKKATDALNSRNRDSISHGDTQKQLKITGGKKKRSEAGGMKKTDDQQESHPKPKEVVICRFKSLGGAAKPDKIRAKDADNDKTTNDAESV